MLKSSEIKERLNILIYHFLPLIHLFSISIFKYVIIKGIYYEQDSLEKIYLDCFFDI